MTVRPPDIIGCAGGHCMLNLEELPRRGDTVLAVSSSDDRKLWPQLRRLHPDLMIVSTEGLMLSVMQQQLMLKAHRFKC